MSQAVIVDAVRSPMGRGRPGGALSNVHPVDVLAQVLTTMLGQLDATGGRFGLQTMCEAGGMANAMIVERLGSGS